MTIQVLEKKILEFSVENKIQTEEIINVLSSYLELSYSDKDQSLTNHILFKDLKIKILACLYNKSDYKFFYTNMIGCEVELNINAVELDLLNDALVELENEGNIYTTENEIGLLAKGLVEYENMIVENKKD